MAQRKRLVSKNILMIIASKNFRDEEYFIPFQFFQKEGAKIITASSIEGDIMGVHGGEAVSNLTLQKIEMENFDAVVFVGGGGASEFFENGDAHRIISDTIKLYKVLAAICIAPVILAKAGVLDGKNATVWSSALDKNGKKELEKAGCSVLDKNVVVDGNIITANGPAVAEEFAKEITEAIFMRSVS
ncbi:MAG: DJ-1/PfpI family protein [Candidatus Pacebacteria bacterium]|nr:DJ-1/PfpI family protein [Candidatus Paceibacterota bacterium]